jgi:hypothetical protein
MDNNEYVPSIGFSSHSIFRNSDLKQKRDLDLFVQLVFSLYHFIKKEYIFFWRFSAADIFFY